jgi:hypothetical protein
MPQYTLKISGDGAEVVLGNLTAENVKFLKSIDLESYCGGDVDLSGDEPGEPPFDEGSWYDCDDIEHCSGPILGSCMITVTAESGDIVFESEASSEALAKAGIFIEFTHLLKSSITEKKIFVGQAFSRGTFNYEPFSISDSFDASLLQIKINRSSGENILEFIYYDGKIINEEGQDGVGSGISFSIVGAKEIIEKHSR